MIFNCVSLCVSCAVSFVFDCVFLCVVSFDDCMISKIWGRLNSTISAGMEINLCRGFPPEWKSVCSVDFRRVEKGRLKEGGGSGPGEGRSSIAVVRPLEPGPVPGGAWAGPWSEPALRSPGRWNLSRSRAGPASFGAGRRGGRSYACAAEERKPPQGPAGASLRGFLT